MLKIGITGSIGSGKSTVARNASAALDIPVFDADQAVHDLYATDKNLQKFIVRKCGRDILENGDINRKKLGDVMRDESRKEEWQEILAEVRVALWKAYDAFVEEKKSEGCKAIIADIPLLFETGAESRFDYTINVFLPYEEQKRRALAREKPKLTEEDFEKRYKTFMPTELRNRKADFTIDNLGEAAASLLQFRHHLSKMKDPEAASPSLIQTFNETAVYVGSFDPITLGHIDVVRSAIKMPYKTFYVAVGINPAKKSMFTIEEKIAMIEHEMDRDIRPHLPAGREIIVTSYEGLTVEFMRSVNASLCVRGLRGIKDLEEENDLNAVNKGLFADGLNPGSTAGFTQTYFPSRPDLRHVSSSYARALCTAKHDLSLLGYVSPDVAAKMIQKRDMQP